MYVICLLYDQKVWDIFGEIEYRNSLLFQKKPSKTFLEDFFKMSGSDQIWGSGGYTKPTFFFLRLDSKQKQWVFSFSLSLFLVGLSLTERNIHYTLLNLTYEVKISTPLHESHLHVSFHNNKNHHCYIWVRAEVEHMSE